MLAGLMALSASPLLAQETCKDPAPLAAAASRAGEAKPRVSFLCASLA